MSGDWRYNDGPCVGITSAHGNGTVSGTYYSCGQVQFYNGNTYTTYTSNASPKLTYTASAASSSDLTFGNSVINSKSLDLFRDFNINGTNNDLVIKENKKGETYGSGLIVDTSGSLRIMSQ